MFYFPFYLTVLWRDYVAACPSCLTHFISVVNLCFLSALPSSALIFHSSLDCFSVRISFHSVLLPTAGTSYPSSINLVWRISPAVLFLFLSVKFILQDVDKPSPASKCLSCFVLIQLWVVFSDFLPLISFFHCWSVESSSCDDVLL